MENFATKEQVALLTENLIEANGHLLALGVAVRTLLLTHPNRDEAITSVTAELMRWEAFGLNSDAPDALLKGFDRARHTIFPTSGDLERVPQK
ncbi:hypothetical protein IFT43_15030 [Oxalobacteraceae sp. CFBP 13708]|nr:hypothetical protein [Oxalobacteraceae sp. CFBP 13708]